MALPPVLSETLRIPVIGSPLFIISNPDLVIAQCKAGIVGSFPALNARPEPVLDEWLQRINDELDRHNQENPDNPAAPYAVNQIVHGSNARLEYDMEMCVKHKAPIVITSWVPRNGSTKRCTATAASPCMTSSTTVSPRKPWKRRGRA